MDELRPALEVAPCSREVELRSALKVVPRVREGVFRSALKSEVGGRCFPSLRGGGRSSEDLQEVVSLGNAEDVNAQNVDSCLSVPTFNVGMVALTDEVARPLVMAVGFDEPNEIRRDKLH